jgi:hypothetical protein
MRAVTRATAMRRTVVSAVFAVLCLPASWAGGQHAKPAPPAAPRSGQAREGGRQQAPRGRAGQQQVKPVAGQGGGYNAGASRGQPASPYPNPQGGTRPVYPGSQNSGPQNLGSRNPGTQNSSQGAVRPALPGYPGSPVAPPGHLQSWLNDHKNVPVLNQEQQLRSDPSFKRLPPSEQQRLVQQLHNVNQMPEEQRQRRLAWAENLERMSPEDRMKVNRSAREWRALPADRQAVMKNAFRDLRTVPPDQRSIVLNSARYQGQFTPQERGILGDMLRVEPYEAPK